MKTRINLRWTAFLIVLIFCAAYPWIMLSQEKKGYELSENQRLRLEVQQSRFTLAQEHYQQAANAFNAEVKTIEKENSWPDDLQFDPNALTFRELPKPPAPPDKMPPEKPAQSPTPAPK